MQRRALPKCQMEINKMDIDLSSKYVSIERNISSTEKSYITYFLVSDQYEIMIAAIRNCTLSLFNNSIHDSYQFKNIYKMKASNQVAVSSKNKVYIFDVSNPSISPIDIVQFNELLPEPDLGYEIFVDVDNITYK